MKKARFLSIALVLLFVFSMIPLTVSAAASVYDGKPSTQLRTEGDKVYIDSAADLALFSQNVCGGNTYKGKQILITTDITWNSGKASDWATKAPANNWTSIGNWGAVLEGSIDGQGHTISGLYMNVTTDNNGFVGATWGDVEIKNLAIVNSYFKATGKGNLGGVVGVNKGNGTLTISNVYCDTILECDANVVGGLVSRIHGNGTAVSKLVMSNSTFAGSVTGKDSVGGLFGYSYSNPSVGANAVTITDSTNLGTVTANHYAGGILAGSDKELDATVKNCVNIGKVTATGENGTAAAILGGTVKKETVTNCYYLKDSAEKASVMEATATVITADKLQSTLTNFIVTQDGAVLPKSVATMIGATAAKPEDPVTPPTSDSDVLLIAVLGGVALMMGSLCLVLKNKKKDTL